MFHCCDEIMWMKPCKEERFILVHSFSLWLLSPLLWTYGEAEHPWPGGHVDQSHSLCGSQEATQKGLGTQNALPGCSPAPPLLMTPLPGGDLRASRI